MARLTLAVALLTALAAPAAAQTARISGVVADPSGAVLPAVEIRAMQRNSSGETTHSVVTDAVGRYQLDNLTAGAWTLTMTLPGFALATQRVTVEPGEALEWSETLQLGMLQETVSISSAAADRPVRQEAPRPYQVPPSPAAVTPARAGTVRVGGSITPPRIAVRVNPVYPADAAAQGVSGVVILQGVIGIDGFVRDITTLRSPNDSLTLAASGAFNEWQFTPTLLNGVPVPVRIIVTFNFQHQL